MNNFTVKAYNYNYNSDVGENSELLCSLSADIQNNNNLFKIDSLMDMVQLAGGCIMRCISFQICISIEFGNVKIAGLLACVIACLGLACDDIAIIVCF